jgi:sensor histidine kinase regulating citrate/malate metabolism
VLLVLVGVPFLTAVESYERERLRSDLTRDAVVIASSVEDELAEQDPSPSQLEPIARAYASRSGARVVILDRDGLLRADSAVTAAALEDPAERRSMRSRPEFQSALAGRFAAITRHSTTLGYSALFVAVPVASSGQIYGAVRVSFATRDVDRRIAVQRTRLIGFGLGATPERRSTAVHPRSARSPGSSMP